MFIILISALVLSVSTSFLCSLMESAYYAVSLPYVKSLADSGSKLGGVLLKFKEDMSRPISAILILNTVANTIGASVSGWAVGEYFGSQYLFPFSIGYTLMILYCGEIIPKLLGVTYNKLVAKIFAYPLLFLSKILSPLIAVSHFVAKLFKSKEGEEVSTAEVLSMAEMGEEDGALDSLESAVIENIIGLDQILVGGVMTPRVVVKRFDESLTIKEIKTELEDLSFTRIPLYSETDPDDLKSYVIQRDIFRAIVQGHEDKTLREISRPLRTVSELMRCDKLLLEMFDVNEHFYSVIDEHGGLAGIITIEDIIEEIVGHEIVDEYDAVSNLRAFARLLRFKKWRDRKKQGLNG